jgi:hypothetical protein
VLCVAQVCFLCFTAGFEELCWGAAAPAIRHAHSRISGRRQSLLLSPYSSCSADWSWPMTVRAFPDPSGGDGVSTGLWDHCGHSSQSELCQGPTVCPLPPAYVSRHGCIILSVSSCIPFVRFVACRWGL